MRKIYFLAILTALCLSALNQDAVFKKLPDGLTPVIDGQSDSLWAVVEKHDIDQSFQLEIPTIVMATWQAVWNDTAIFVLISVIEDDFYPHYISGMADWESDKPQIYFDVNEVLDDTLGPAMPNSGHYEVSPPFFENGNGILTNYYDLDTSRWYKSYAAFVVDDPDYVFEYAILIESLIDKYGLTLDPFSIDLMGFDVSIIDRDEGDEARRRAVWKNTGETDESWNNMDDCGEIEFSTELIPYSGYIPEPEPEPDAIVKKLPSGLVPEVDGSKDALWDKVEKQHVDLFFPEEYPTLDIATWQAVWNDTAIFVIVSVEEDDFCPPWCEPAQPPWFSDKIEIYLDVNDTLEDGKGPATYPNGHYQFAPDFIEGENVYSYSGDSWQGYIHYAYEIDEPDYIFEYAVPLATLVDEYLEELVPVDGKQIGFDVYVIDRDAGESERNRAVWVNNLTGPNAMEAWNNMDDCGIVEFSTDTIDYPDTIPQPVPDAIIRKLPMGAVPEIDGSPDVLWKYVEKHNIEKPFQQEEPTIDQSTWQAVWNDTALFVMVSVEEDNFCPPWCEPPQIDWMADRTEIYLDVNDNLKDGGGPVSPPEGHYVFWPGFTEGEDQYGASGESYLGWYYHYAYKVIEPDYIFEYAIPFTTLENINMDELIPADGKQIGFDVCVVDRDEGEDIRKRTVWMNDGKGPASVESWSNMDDCGIVEFSTDTIDYQVIHQGEFFTYCEFEDILPELATCGDDSYEIIANPDKDIYNSSDSVVVIYAGSNNTFEGCMIPAGGTFYSNYVSAIKIMFYSTVSGYFQIIPVSRKDSLFGVPVSAEYTQVGLWQELTFVMPENTFAVNYDYLLILPYQTGTGKWYFDEISGNAAIVYGDRVTVTFKVNNTTATELGDENYIIVDNYSYRLYNNGKWGDEIAEDNIWSRTIQLEGFKLGKGGGYYLWQPLIDAEKLDKKGLFLVAGQEPDTAEYLLIGPNSISTDITDFKIYPVPASDYLYIQDADRLLHVTIFDVFGKEIKTVVNQEAGTLRIDLGDIKQGVYFIRLTDTSDNITTKTLLKE